MPSGTAALSWDPTTKLITTTINAYGFAPGLAHAMHIHPGSCANQDQPPSVPFPDIAASSAGAVDQRVASQPVPNGIPTGSYLNIHLAPSAELGNPTDISFTPIACADIPPGTPPTGPVTLHLAPPPAHAPNGLAQLTYDNAQHSLRVALHASGLPPNSDHAVHIHDGTCQAQGDVRYPLPDLHTDAVGNATLTATVNNASPPASGWYLNIHFGSSGQILSNNQPTPLFAPVLCGDVNG